MLLTLQYSIIAAPIKDYTDFNYDEWEEGDEEEHPYFGVGHGDYSEEHGYSPAFIVWAMINGKLEVSEPIDPEEEGDDFGGGETHGSLWGHNVTDRDYKGRYEPETGRLMIVKPERFRYREIPNVITQKLESKFKNITEIRVF
jgi:hypothetical protein